MKLTRRQLLKVAAGTGAGVALGGGLTLRPLNVQALEIPVQVGNPLEVYPERDWEQVYQDQYKYEDYSPLLRDILSRGLRETRQKEITKS